MIDIEYNKKKFLERVENLIRKNRPDNSWVNGLVEKLCGSDFFYAPATTKYVGSYRGGLCEFQLRVHDILDHLNKQLPKPYDDCSIAIAGLLSGVGKMNFYETYFKNEKRYLPDEETIPQGTKHDEHGYFEWVSVPGVKVKEADKRFIYGTVGQNSEYIVRCYIPLTTDESAALMVSSDDMSTLNNVHEVYGKYPLSALLKTAIMLATYTDMGKLQ